MDDSRRNSVPHFLQASIGGRDEVSDFGRQLFGSIASQRRRIDPQTGQESACVDGYPDEPVVTLDLHSYLAEGARRLLQLLTLTLQPCTFRYPHR